MLESHFLMNINQTKMDQTLLKVLARHADELCNSDTSRAKTSRLLSDSNHPYAKMDLETISNHIFDSVNRIKLANSIRFLFDLANLFIAISITLLRCFYWISLVQF